MAKFVQERKVDISQTQVGSEEGLNKENSIRDRERITFKDS